MSMLRNMLGGALALSLVATASAASARPWGPGWGHHRGYGRYHHHGSGTAGALIGGLLIGGAVAAVASAADDANDRRASASDYDAPPPPPPLDPEPAGEATSQGEAVDACSAVALEATRGGQVNDVTRATRWDGGWRVEGVLDRGTADASGYRALDRFSCTVRYGQVDDFQIGGTPVAWRD